MAEVEKISGEEGNFDVTITMGPRYVNEKCTACGKCAEACTMEIDNPFNYGMDKMKAAYLPHVMAYPMRYVLDPALVESDEAQEVKASCPYDAIELDMQPKTMDLKVGSIVWATGWKPYDANKLETYGFEVGLLVGANAGENCPPFQRRTSRDGCVCPVRWISG
jgi:quinone-modifying oxidoreductase subunit QmoA